MALRLRLDPAIHPEIFENETAVPGMKRRAAAYGM